MSTASRVIPRISGASSNTHIKYLLGTLGLSTASLGMYYQSCASEERAYLEKANKKLSAQKKPTTINGENVMYYPWVRDPTKDHEFELVKMRGYFKEGRFMVQKERDGRRGYLVFAPFITRHEGPGQAHPHPDAIPRPGASGIMVNLGWVPFENRMEITKDSEPLGRMDFEEIDFGGANEFFDPYSNWWYKKQYDEDTEEEYPFTDVTGIVRRSETMNPMIGNTNIPSQWHFQYIDTSYMKMLFQMKNDVDFDDHYLERFVEDLEDDDSFPVPATRNNFQVSTGTPDLYSRYARNSSLVSAVSFAGLAALMLL